jgi:hypothetical protein
VPEEPKRWLLIHYDPAGRAPMEPIVWLGLRDSLLFSERKGDRVLPTHAEARTGEFQSKPCVVMEGIWQNEEFLRMDRSFATA